LWGAVGGGKRFLFFFRCRHLFFSFPFYYFSGNYHWKKASIIPQEHDIFAIHHSDSAHLHAPAQVQRDHRPCAEEDSSCQRPKDAPPSNHHLPSPPYDDDNNNNNNKMGS